MHPNRLETAGRAMVALLALTLSSAAPAAGQCSYTALTSGVVTSEGNASQAHYSFSGTANWAAIAVQSVGGTSDHDLRVYETTAAFPTCVATLLASSSLGGSTTDFVVGDFNHNTPGTYFGYTLQFSGAGTHQVEFEEATNQLLPNEPATAISSTIPGNDIIQVYEAYLEAGVSYKFDFALTGPSGSSHTMMLFRNPGTTYWAGRLSNVYQQTVNVAAGTYVAPASDWYGIVLVSSVSATPGTYTGSLRITGCTPPTALASGTPTTAFPTVDYFSINQSANYWTAVGVRRNLPLEDWDLTLYSGGSGGVWPICYTGALTASTGASPSLVDFVVGDFNHNLDGTYYVRPYLFSGANSAQVEWETGDQTLAVNSKPILRDTSPSDVLEVWDVFLAAGTTYTLDLANVTVINPGTLHAFVFRNPGATYWAARSAAIASTATNASVTFTATTSDWYGIVVANEDGMNGTYALQIGTCSTPEVMSSGASNSTSAGHHYMSFNEGSSYWHALATRSAGADYDIAMYSLTSGGSWPVCFGGELATSSNGGEVDVVAANCNVGALPPGTFTGTLFYWSGVGSVSYEWDGGANQVAVNGATVNRATDAADVIEIWDVFLSEGVHATFHLDATVAGIRMLLFSDDGSPHAFGRANAAFDVDDDITYVPPHSGYYGVAVINSDGLAGNYSLSVTQDALAVDEALPKRTEFARAAPNPSRGAVELGFALSAGGRVAFDVYDMAGRQVGGIAARDLAAGRHTASWSGAGDHGGRLAAGVYWVRMRVDGRTVEQRRVALLE